MFKNILLLIVAITIVIANSGCSTPTPAVTEKVNESSFLEELALANPQLLEEQEQPGDQMVSDWRAQQQLLPYPHGWAKEGSAGIEKWEDYLERFKRKYPD